MYPPKFKNNSPKKYPGNLKVLDNLMNEKELEIEEKEDATK